MVLVEMPHEMGVRDDEPQVSILAIVIDSLTILLDLIIITGHTITHASLIQCCKASWMVIYTHTIINIIICKVK